MISLESKPQINPSIRSRNEKFGKLIIAPNLPMLCINKDAALIWDLCDGNTTVDVIIHKISPMKTEDFSSTEKKVKTFLEELLRLNLISINEK